MESLLGGRRGSAGSPLRPGDSRSLVRSVVSGAHTRGSQLSAPSSALTDDGAPDEESHARLAARGFASVVTGGDHGGSARGGVPRCITVDAAREDGPSRVYSWPTIRHVALSTRIKNATERMPVLFAYVPDGDRVPAECPTLRLRSCAVKRGVLETTWRWVGAPRPDADLPAALTGADDFSITQLWERGVDPVLMAANVHVQARMAPVVGTVEPNVSFHGDAALLRTSRLFGGVVRRLFFVPLYLMFAVLPQRMGPDTAFVHNVFFAKTLLTQTVRAADVAQLVPTLAQFERESNMASMASMFGKGKGKGKAKAKSDDGGAVSSLEVPMPEEEAAAIAVQRAITECTTPVLLRNTLGHGARAAPRRRPASAVSSGGHSSGGHSSGGHSSGGHSSGGHSSGGHSSGGGGGAGAGAGAGAGDDYAGAGAGHAAAGAGARRPTAKASALHNIVPTLARLGDSANCIYVRGAVASMVFDAITGARVTLTPPDAARLQAVEMQPRPATSFIVRTVENCNTIPMEMWVPDLRGVRFMLVRDMFGREIDMAAALPLATQVARVLLTDILQDDTVMPIKDLSLFVPLRFLTELVLQRRAAASLRSEGKAGDARVPDNPCFYVVKSRDVATTLPYLAETAFASNLVVSPCDFKHLRQDMHRYTIQSMTYREPTRGSVTEFVRCVYALLYRDAELRNHVNRIRARFEGRSEGLPFLLLEPKTLMSSRVVRECIQFAVAICGYLEFDEARMTTLPRHIYSNCHMVILARRHMERLRAERTAGAAAKAAKAAADGGKADGGKAGEEESEASEVGRRGRKRGRPKVGSCAGMDEEERAIVRAVAGDSDVRAAFSKLELRFGMPNAPVVKATLHALAWSRAASIIPAAAVTPALRLQFAACTTLLCHMAMFGISVVPLNAYNRRSAQERRATAAKREAAVAKKGGAGKQGLPAHRTFVRKYRWEFPSGAVQVDMNGA